MHWKKYFKISEGRSNGLRLLFLPATLSIICLASCTSFEYLTASGDDFAHAKDCGKCHVDIYREWSQSDHAKAYVNPYFRKATNDYTFESCIGCHAPQPQVTDLIPAARTTAREDGVTCVSCHLKDGKLSGPITPTGAIRPHPIRIDEEFYRGVAICGSCHEGTLKEWNSVEGYKKTCQQCHMQPVTRNVTQATGGISNIIVAFEKKGALRRHDFSVSGDYIPGRIIGVTAERTGSVLTVQVTNTLPHNLPTGDFGFRVLGLEAVAVDKQNREIVLGKRELAPELSNEVAPNGVLTWKVDIPPDAVKASVRLMRKSYEPSDVTMLANVEVSF